MRENDNELLELINEGNEDALNCIYNKYRPIIIKKSKDAIMKVPHHGVEISDIMQEGFIALDEAINNFNEKDNDNSFYTFALLCIDRKITNYLRKSYSNRDRILNDAIAIDDNLERVISDNCDTEMNLINELENNDIKVKINSILTDFEKEVFKLKCEMYTSNEIASILKKDNKSIYNTLQRIKIKIKKFMEKDKNSND